jgi:heat shock protein HslJ
MRNFVNQLLALAPMALIACTTVPPAGPTAPIGTYKALGTEPFWSLAIDRREMTFEEMNMPAPIVQPTPRPVMGIAGEIYQTQRINVNIVHARCSDGMSERIYADTVQVTVDGNRFEGCGGDAVPPETLAETNWQVATVNGRRVPAPNDFFLIFEASRLSAKFGCNGISADYRQAGDTITAGPVRATRMACPDMSFETQGGAILAQPMRMTWKDGDQLALSNEQGSIELTRSY